jgi:hypothetical protein
VKRAVWLRDLGRCAFVGTGGRRCEERRFLEFHHVKPYAVGGEATAPNIALRCRRHNAHEAMVFFARDLDHGASTVREAQASYLPSPCSDLLASTNSFWTESPIPIHRPHH